MRRLLVPAFFVFLACALVGACAKASSDLDGLKPGATVTVTMKDGTVVAGRFVEARADQLVIDPAEGGEWKTLPRAQVAAVAQTNAAGTTAAPATAAVPGATASMPGGESAQPPAASVSAGPHGARVSAGGASVTAGGANVSARSGAAAGNAAVSTPEPPRPEFREMTVPADTLVHLRLDTPIASDTSRVEDPVRASLSKPLVIDGTEVVPADSEFKGVITDAQASGKVKGRAAIAFRFDTLTADGQQYRVRTQAVAREAEASTRKDAMKIGIPAAGGAILGGILGGGKGAAIGGAIGGGAGTAVVLTTPGKELRLPAGTALTVKLLEPLTVRVPVSR